MKTFSLTFAIISLCFSILTSTTTTFLLGVGVVVLVGGGVLAEPAVETEEEEEPGGGGGGAPLFEASRDDDFYDEEEEIEDSDDYPTTTSDDDDWKQLNFLEVLKKCEIDYESLANQELESVMELFPDFCNDNQIIQFEAALTEFSACAQFDLVRAVETLSDGILGSSMECAIATIPEVTKILNGLETTMILPDACLDSFLGPHPLGDMLRTLYLYPDRSMKCFETLSTPGKLPVCTYDKIWPIPLIGPILQKTTCMLGAAQPWLDFVVTQELMAWTKCLPETSKTIVDCEGTAELCKVDSWIITLPEPLLGSPLPDVFARVAATDKGLQDGQERYQQFASTCAIHKWDGWYATAPPVADKSSASGRSSSSSSSSSSSALGSTGASASSLAVPNKNSGGGGGGGSFFSGMLLGMCLLGSVWAVVTFRGGNNRRGPDGERYDSVEMVPKDLSLSYRGMS